MAPNHHLSTSLTRERDGRTYAAALPEPLVDYLRLDIVATRDDG